MGKGGRRSANKRVRSPKGKRPHRKTFYICVEGGAHNKTKRNYLDLLKNGKSNFYISNRAETDVIRLYNNGLEWLKEANKGLIKSDRQLNKVFIVFDLDFDPATKKKRIDFARKHSTDQIHFIPSNPTFEYWLLLHFENSKKLYSNNTQLINDLMTYIKNYRKEIKYSFTEEQIQTACDRARQYLNPRGILTEKELLDEVEKGTGTLVYLLVEYLLNDIF